MGVFRRFYLVRPVSALILCLPGLLVILWYSWKAYSSFDQYRRFVGQELSLSAEDFQIQLHDVLSSDLHKIMMPAPSQNSSIEHFSFDIDSDSLSTLFQGLELEEKRPYVPARLEHQGTVYDVKVRLRGQQHWHILGGRKSLKVKMKKGDLINGQRVFNLTNDPTPMVVGEKIILDTAADVGLVTPRSFFVRLLINKVDQGVVYFLAQPDESVLRGRDRIPGSLYSGNLPPSADTAQLWNNPSRWKKVAWHSPAEEKTFDDLKGLLEKISSSTVEDFVEFARENVDLRKFALFDALDVAFGGEQHDFRQNHKLYFDPYRGHWEPVAWSFRGFRHEPRFNLVDNPLLIRLKQIPEYLSLRNRVLYELLVSEGSVASVHDRGLKILKTLLPELATDPDWRAYKLLPPIDSFHRRMVRPMSLEKAGLVFESEMNTYAERHRYLLRELEKNHLWILVGEHVSGQTPVHLVVDGQVGVQLKGFRVTWPNECAQPKWQVFKEALPLTALSSGDRVDLDPPLDLFPRVGLVAREDPSPNLGLVRAEGFPASFPFLIQSNCRPVQIVADGVQLAIQSRIHSRAVTPEVLERLPEHTLRPTDVPKFMAGEIAPHPWELKKPQAHSIHLGPGPIEVPSTYVFGVDQSVEIAAGTEFRMAEDASLIFFGPVLFGGSREKPIVIKSATDKPWGGIAVQGPGTAGSTLEYVVALSGTSPKFQSITYPGMVNIHDSSQITVRDCQFGQNHVSDDALHVVYVDGFRLEDTRIEDTASDAVDLEFVKGKVQGVEIRRAGDDGIDLMGATVEVVDGVILGAKNNGLSIGELSHVRMRDHLIADSGTGVLLKNASTVDLSDSLIYRCKKGLRVNEKDRRYSGDSQLNADVLFLVKAERDIQRKDQQTDTLNSGRVQRRLPQDDSLDHLLKDVLDLEQWKDLAGWIDGRPGEGRP